MSNEQTSPTATGGALTQHAMLVAWGIYAQQLGLVKQLEQVKLSQKQRDHSPQTKVLEFLVAILAGLPYLQDISQSAHPLDQDMAVAAAWGQSAWADYSGVSRTLKSLDANEVEAIAAVIGLGTIQIHTGKQRQAVSWLRMAVAHPATPHHIRQEVEATLAAVQGEYEGAGAASLAEVVATALAIPEEEPKEST